MPDPNKLAVLSDLGYHVPASCGLCVNGRFFAPGLDWGTCKAFAYDHAKHGRRDLSVNRNGACASDFQLNAKKRADLERSGFLQFMDEADVVERLPVDE